MEDGADVTRIGAPRKMGLRQERGRPLATEGPWRSPTPGGSAGVVLLIEPHADSREMYTEYLRTCGFVLVIAETTDDGLARAVEADIIVTGIRVPGVCDGVELVRRLRHADETRRTPIIVLTACVFNPDRQRALAAGCDAFLAKPCLPDRLLAEIRRALMLRRLAPPSSVSAPTRAKSA